MANDKASKVSSRFPSPDMFFGTSSDLARIVEIDLAQIVANPDQPRRGFPADKLQELADSISEHGLISPITVRKVETGYMIVAGERRFRAFGLIARATIPAIIVDDTRSDEIALIENIQRENLSPLDEFDAVARLIEKHGYSQGDAGKALGKSRVSVNELMTLRSLATAIREEAQIVGASKSALIEIARAGDEQAQMALWNATKDKGGTVSAARAAKGDGGDRKEVSLLDMAKRDVKRLMRSVEALPDDVKHRKIKATGVALSALLDEVG